MYPESRTVPRIPLSAPDIGEREEAALLETLRSGRLSLGAKLELFEHAVADRCGAAHAVAVSSGTAGLHLALHAAGVGQGDEVITSPFSFVASANAIVHAGARPIFVDIDPRSLNMDSARIEGAVTPRTRAILPVHVFAHPAEMTPILQTARRHRLHVVEDACESIGGRLAGRWLGTLGDAGVFAFYPNKQITTGEGGMVVTDDERLARKVAAMRNQGRSEMASFSEDGPGYNYRLSELHCALGLTQLERLDSILERRRIVAEGYQRRLEGGHGLILPDAEPAGSPRSWFVYVVRFSDDHDAETADRIAAAMREYGIACGRYFAPIHLLPYYRRTMGGAEGDHPVAERAARRTLALPFFNAITEAQIDEVCDRLLTLVQGIRSL
jgi:perosamine synthetase